MRLDMKNNESKSTTFRNPKWEDYINGDTYSNEKDLKEAVESDINNAIDQIKEWNKVVAECQKKYLR